MEYHITVMDKKKSSNKKKLAYPWQSYYEDSDNVKLDSYKELNSMFANVFKTYERKRAFTQVLPNGMEASINYEELQNASDNFAIFLKEKWKLNKGDRIAVQMPNCLAYPLVALGVWKAGLALVNINPLSTDKEMADKFDDAEIKGLVIIDLFSDKLTLAKERLKKLKQLDNVVMVSLVDFFPLPRRMLVHLILKYVKKQIPSYGGKSITLSRALAWSKVYVSKNIKFDRRNPKRRDEDGRQGGFFVKDYVASIKEDDIALLQYTGGTTGNSKAAILTHKNIIANVNQISQCVYRRLTEGEEIFLTALPFYHVFAFTVNFVFAFFIGSHNVIVPSPRPIDNLKKVFDKYSFTMITGVNTLFNALNEAEWFKDNHPTNVKLSIAGGMSLQKSVADKWMNICGVPIIEGYGLTEASPVVCLNPLKEELIKIDSIGIPLPSTEVKCVDEKGTEVKIGKVGELIVKGPQVMRGYWRNDKETEQAIKNDWLYTGDLATMDEEGYFKIVDRKKDMINVSGLKVYSIQVEDVIVQVDGVLEVAVIGIEDKKSGEVPIAYAVRADSDAGRALSESDIIDRCKKNLSDYKVPKQVIFRTELPKTAVGKIHKKALKDELISK